MGRAAPGPSWGHAGGRLSQVLSDLRVLCQRPLSWGTGGTEGQSLGTAPGCPCAQPAAPPRAQGILQPLQNCIKGSTFQRERNCRSFSQGSGFLMPPESVVRFSRLRNNYITNVNNINIPKTKYDLNTFGWYKRKNLWVSVQFLQGGNRRCIYNMRGANTISCAE